MCSSNSFDKCLQSCNHHLNNDTVNHILKSHFFSKNPGLTPLIYSSPSFNFPNPGICGLHPLPPLHSSVLTPYHIVFTIATPRNCSFSPSRVIALSMILPISQCIKFETLQWSLILPSPLYPLSNMSPKSFELFFTACPKLPSSRLLLFQTLFLHLRSSKSL